MLNRTVKDQLVQALRDEIIRGNLHPGQYLRQEDLAERFEVSTMPIREALRDLEADGLVTIYPHRGAIVCSLSPEDLEDIYDTRALLEEMATRLAVPRLSETTFDEMSAILDELDHHLKDVLIAVNLNHRFHSTLYAASGRQHLCELQQVLRRRTHHYLYAYITCLGDMPQAQAEHRAILEACRRRNAEQAAAITRDHVTRVGHALIRYVKERGSKS
ncbi:MAG: GntR family transcriptional regulator [Acidobacteriota bacterium]